MLALGNTTTISSAAEQNIPCIALPTPENAVALFVINLASRTGKDTADTSRDRKSVV